MKTVIIICMTSLLSLIAKAQESNWVYSDSKDEFSGKQTYLAVLKNDTTKDSFKTTLTVRYGHDGNNALISIEGASFNVRANRIVFHIKTDDGETYSFIGSRPDDRRSTTLFIQPAERFITKIMRSKNILLQITLYNKGTYLFHFDTEDLIWPHL